MAQSPRFTPGGGQDLMLPEDIMGEDESLALYPLGPSFMPVTAAADWNGTGHSGMVETTRGVAGGTQVFSDEEAEEAPTAYERRWFGSEWGAWAEVGGGGADPTLAEDERAETDPITDYPEGTSNMLVTDTADWAGVGYDAEVITERTGDVGRQVIVYADPPEEEIQEQVRYWTNDAWGNWVSPATVEWVNVQDFAYFADTRNLPSMEIDTYAESDPITSYYSGLSAMPVSAGANWGPNTGQAGYVKIEAFGTEGGQVFTQYSNNVSYRRVYASDAWSSWVDVKGAS